MNWRHRCATAADAPVWQWQLDTNKGAWLDTTGLISAHDVPVGQEHDFYTDELADLMVATRQAGVSMTLGYTHPRD